MDRIKAHSIPANFIIAALAVLLMLGIAVIFFQFVSSSDERARSSAAIAQLEGQNAMQGERIAFLEGESQNYKSLSESTSEKLGQANNRFNALQAEYYNASAALEETKARLGETQGELSVANATLAELEKNLTLIKDGFSALKTDVSASMSWFKANAALPTQSSPSLWNLADDSERECIDGGQLNLACMVFTMERQTPKLRYLRDIDAGNIDRLQSINETALRGGGDCEDYSLFFKALFNSVKQKAGSSYAMAWTPSVGDRLIVYPRPSIAAATRYIVDNAKKVELGDISELNPYVFCYTINKASGHCVVGLSRENVTSASQIGRLEGALLFEPQAGKYLGAVGREFKICNPASLTCNETPNTIILVISDNDLFTARQGDWTGYGDILGKLKEF